MSNPTLYINKINDSILFDEKNKEFTICDGSLGTYKFCDAVRSQIVYEHARYKGKSPLFSHRVLISTFNTSIFIELDTFNKLGYKAKINIHTTSYIN